MMDEYNSNMPSIQRDPYAFADVFPEEGTFHHASCRQALFSAAELLVLGRGIVSIYLPPSNHHHKDYYI